MGTKFRQNTHRVLLKEAILSNKVDGEMVFYINADDNFRGLVEKIELAELWGMHMIAPNHNGFMISQVSEIMARMADMEVRMARSLFWIPLKSLQT